MSTDDTCYEGLISKMYKERVQLNTKEHKESNSKVGKGPEQTLLQGGRTDGR